MSASALNSSVSVPVFPSKILARSLHLHKSRQPTQDTLDGSPILMHGRPPRCPSPKPTPSEVYARTRAFLTSRSPEVPQLSLQHLFSSVTQKTCDGQRRAKIERQADQTLKGLLRRHGANIIQKIIEKRESWDPLYAHALAHIRTRVQPAFKDTATDRSVVTVLNDITPVRCCEVERLTANCLSIVTCLDEDEIVIELDFT